MVRFRFAAWRAGVRAALFQQATQKPTFSNERGAFRYVKHAFRLRRNAALTGRFAAFPSENLYIQPMPAGDIADMQ
jgi:hypothetical protein